MRFDIVITKQLAHINYTMLHINYLFNILPLYWEESLKAQALKRQ